MLHQFPVFKSSKHGLTLLLIPGHDPPMDITIFIDVPKNSYTLLDGLAYNTRGYFASCVVFFRAPQGRGKMRAMSKMSASIIC